MCLTPHIYKVYLEQLYGNRRFNNKILIYSKSFCVKTCICNHTDYFLSVHWLTQGLVTFCTSMTISRQNEARCRDYAPHSLNYVKCILTCTLSYTLLHSRGLRTILITIYTQPRWQTKDPVRIWDTTGPNEPIASGRPLFHVGLKKCIRAFNKSW